ncbi:MAG: site-specific DNA-methyltransferase [Acidimicrobiia bacterium]
MPRARKATAKPIEPYDHKEATRLNNPEAGLARYETEAPPKKRFEYQYDPRMDPQLEWAGKAERTNFDVDAVSIHVHERLSTEAIIATVRKEPPQLAMFNDPELERDKEIGFYQHEVDWTNRLILGDSLVVMTSLLERERMGGQVQCIYVDPPYGINYNSNFQADIANRSPRETDDGALTREPEQIQAYRDTWTLGVHSYLTYLRDRLLVARELLGEEGSIFVQISDTNVHRVRVLLDELFGADNAVTLITFLKTSSAGSPSGGTKTLPTTADYVLWYAKNREKVKYRQLYTEKEAGGAGGGQYTWAELPNGERRRLLSGEALPDGARLFRADNLTSQTGVATTQFPVELDGRTFRPPTGGWKTNAQGMQRLMSANRLIIVGNSLAYVRYIDDFPGFPITEVWLDTITSGFAGAKRYVVQTNPKVIARCLLMSTDPGDLVLDPTCGSGTTAYVAEQYGRRWITTDTSRVAMAVARERVLTATFPYYRLIDEVRGVDAGLRYRTIERTMLRSIVRDEPPAEIALYDLPEVDNSRVRVSGPFTVEALSRYAVNPLHDDVPPDPGELNATADHVDQLLAALKTRGIPVKGAKPVDITTVTRLTGTSPLHAEGTLSDGRSFAVSVGPRYGPITVAQVDEALYDSYGYDLVVFAGFAATAEAQSFLAPGKAGRFDVVLLEANADLLLGDLLRNTSASQTFRLFAAPDASAESLKDGTLFVDLRGVDVYDAAKGEASARSREDIAAWFLDHDYDGEVFHVCQAFFPKTSGWASLARTLKGTLDEDALAQLATFQSNPFTPGEHQRAAVRVVDFAGQTSETVIPLR